MGNLGKEEQWLLLSFPKASGTHRSLLSVVIVICPEWSIFKQGQIVMQVPNLLTKISIFSKVQMKLYMGVIDRVLMHLMK